MHQTIKDMSAIYIKDKDKDLQLKLAEIKDYLIKTRPEGLSLKDLKKLNTTYYLTTTLRYIIEDAYKAMSDGQ